MIICENIRKINNTIYDGSWQIQQMAEASMAAFGAAVGVLIAMAVVTFALRGKGHPEAPDAS